MLTLLMRRLRTMRGRVARIRHDDRVARARAKPVRPHTVLYESFDGHGMLCHPEAIFRHLLASADMEHLDHIWVVSDPDIYLPVITEFARHLRVRFVRYRSAEYFTWLATAGYLVNNSSFPAEFVKRDGQTYLNTWHGVPLKRMGSHIPDGAPDTRNVIRNFVAADYLLAANSFMTKTMYRDAFKLDGIFQGKIIEEGSPRMDRQFTDAGGRQRIRAALRDSGVILDDRKIVVYAPTWKGSNAYTVDADIAQLRAVIGELSDHLDNTRFQVLLKVHQLVYRRAVRESDLGAAVIPNSIPTNQVLAVTDALVTDYSSIFFDYLPLDRPLVYLAPDLPEYLAGRGLYMDAAQWPGPVTSSAAAAARWVLRLAAAEPDPEAVAYGRRRKDWAARFGPKEDGNAAARVADVVFRGRQDGYLVHNDFSTVKARMLIHIGSLTGNGITTTALNLLNAIDYERYDVSVIYPHSGGQVQLENSLRINPKARHFPRVGRTMMRMHERREYRRFMKSGGLGAAHVDLARQGVLFKTEYKRCMGDVEYDIVIAFDGYSAFWPMLLLQSGARRKLIWAHNDLVVDANRTIAGARPHRANLRSLFSFYPHFDRVVSVTGELSRINQQKLLSFAPAESFISVRNLVDAPSALRRAAEPPGYAMPAGAPVFVTSGRLSPEKNQARMIRAMQIVVRQQPRAQLVIIGSGPLHAELTALISSLGLQGNIRLAGFHRNPFPLIAAADCFVFSSNYEGQGLALIEAMILGLPIVTTEYNVVHSVVAPGQALIVESTDEALAAGMLEFVAGNVPAPHFDADEHNSVAMAEFECALHRSSESSESLDHSA